MNTGRDLRFVVASEKQTLRVSGGPLSYEYRLHELVLHYGRSEDGSGSEHTIAGQSFAAELQLYFFNHDLYSDWQESVHQANGVTAIAVLIQVHSSSNHSLTHLISSHVDSVRKKGSSTPLLTLTHVLPSTDSYLTYDGSLTTPSCVESVHWIIINRPIVVSTHDWTRLRSLVQLQAQGNSRPTQPLNSRPIRTNIRPSTQNKASKEDADRMAFCSSRGLVTYKGMQQELRV